MGALLSKEAVHENMVAAVLLGQIAKDDYLARAHKALTELEVGEPASFAAQPWMEFYNVHLMLVPGPQPLEHGMVRLSDGTWFIAAKTDLGTTINGDMFDWWFRHCTGDERFKWLHPIDHKSGDWNPQFYAVQPEDRPRGYYVHHSHKTSEFIGGRTISFQMEYDRPSKFFNVSKFAEAGVTAVVCGRLHILDTLGLVGIAHVVHMVRVVNGRSELRSRIYLGDFNKVRMSFLCSDLSCLLRCNRFVVFSGRRQLDPAAVVHQLVGQLQVFPLHQESSVAGCGPLATHGRGNALLEVVFARFLHRGNDAVAGVAAV